MVKRAGQAGGQSDRLLEGSATSAETQTAYIATGTHGLAIVDASRFQRPLVLGQLDLTGDAVDVAVDARLKIAAVAAGSALHLIDVSDATAPVRTQTVNIPAVQVESANGIAYVAANHGIESYSLLTGELLQVLPLGSANITSLARDGGTLYALDSGGTLHALDLSGLSMSVLGDLVLPTASGKLFVGDGIAYIGAGDGETGGFVTVDVSDPAAMTLLSGVDANNVQGQAIVANGSGLGIAVGQLYSFGYFSTLDVLNVRDPGNTAGFLTRHTLPAAPYDIAIGAGIAFVADGTGGLQVVNYLPFDNQGQAPTITLSAPKADRDSATPGIQALEGSLIDVKLDVNDDQQVRSVELLVDGQAVANDVTFPWSATIALPTLAAATTATIQARATDTGGNTTLSDPLVVELVPDTFAPTIVSSNVVDGSRHSRSFRTVRLQFSEAMDTSTLNPANFRLNDGAGNSVSPLDVAISALGNAIQVTFPTLPPGQYSFLIRADQLHDRASNALGTGETLFGSFSITEATIEWTGGDGDWSNPANWDAGRLPDAFDDVLIDVPAGVTITHSSGETRIHGLVCAEDIVLSGGTLTVDGSITAEAGFTLSGGSISRAELTLVNETMQVATGTRNSRLDGVTVVGDIDLVNASLRLKDVAIDGRVSLANGGSYGYSTLAFEGTQTLAGNAEIVSNFDGYYYSNYLEMQTAGELTLGADVRVYASSLVLGGSLAFNAPMERLINQGTIEADTGSVQVVADAFTNEGVAEATGGALYLSAADNAQTASGRLRVTSGELYTSGDWALPGVIETSGGALYLGGTLHTGGFAGFVSTGGVVNFTGTVENSGSTLTLGAMPGDWVLNGTIHGGTLQIDAGESLMVASGTRNSRLDGVTVVGDIDLVNASLRLKDVAIDGRVSLANGGSYGYSTLAFEGTQTLAGNAEIVSNFDGYYYSNYLEMQTAGELTLGADVRVHGSSLVLGGSLAFNAPMERLINQGTIEADAGTTVDVVVPVFENAGIVQANGGTLNIGGTSFSNSGSIEATGGTVTISTTTFNNEATMRAAAGGLMRFSGTATMSPSSILEVVLGGTLPDEYGRFASSGTLALDGSVKVSLGGGFVPSLGEEFGFLSYGARTGQFVGVEDADGTPGVGYNLTYGSIDATVRAVPG